MKTFLFLAGVFILAGCTEKKYITQAVIVADSLNHHDNGNHYGQDSTKTAPPKDSLR